VDVVRPRPRRGEVWLIDLDPTVGSEIRKKRPCLIVSPDAMNEGLRTVTIMPLTSGSHAAPFRVETKFKQRDGRLLADQLRTVDRLRLRKHLGKVSSDALCETLATLREMFAE
jgi:mRNA interferase MazF